MLPTNLLRTLAARARRQGTTAALPTVLAPLLPSRRPSSTSGTAAPSPRRLGDILHLDKLADASGPEIAAIWVDFHDVEKKKGVADHHPSTSAAAPAHACRLGTTMAADAFSKFRSRAAASPLMALPVLKQGDGDTGTPGALTLLVQAQHPHLLVGTLGEYRDAGPAAPAHAVVTHYDDLADEKGVVLVRTDLVSPHVLSPAEARQAVATLHALYLDEAGHAFIRAFNHAPAGFDWEALCKHLGVEAGG